MEQPTEPALVAYVSIVIARADRVIPLEAACADPVAVSAVGLSALQAALARYVLSAAHAVVDPGPGHLAIASKR